MFITKEIECTTSKAFDIIDLTEQLKDFIKENKVTNWLLNVFTRHTTAILKINEAEDWLRSDIQTRCDTHVPSDIFYKHNDLEHRDPKTMCSSKEECLNGHSHIRSMLLGVSSETIPVKDGQMLLWVRQRILFMEMDHARERSVVVSFIWE